jgi:sec-independent protein translocase protein TatA
MFGTLGVQEIAVIMLLALVLFGPKKLPELGRTIGKALTEFRRASSDLKSSFEREMQNLERETDSFSSTTHSTMSELFNSALNYGNHDSANQIAAGSHSTATENPPTVGASAVSGAESQGTTETAIAVAHPPVEGTVPRSGSPESSEPKQNS